MLADLSRMSRPAKAQTARMPVIAVYLFHFRWFPLLVVRNFREKLGRRGVHSIDAFRISWIHEIALLNISSEFVTSQKDRNEWTNPPITEKPSRLRRIQSTRGRLGNGTDSDFGGKYPCALALNCRPLFRVCRLFHRF